MMEQAEPRLLFAALTALPILHSLPAASAKLFLDFDGQDAIQDWVGTDVPTTPAFSIDDNANDYTGVELNAIREIWGRVAEKYSPFNIDVTTQDPGNRDNQKTSQIVIGGDGEWLGFPAGGVAPLGGFYNDSPNVGFVFSEGFGNSFKGIAEACAHEAGHTFGLEHHSLFDATGNKVDEYDPGNALIAPIMGVSYYAFRGLWSNGPSTNGANVLQDDLAILSDLSTNGFGFRADDHGANLFSATTLVPNLAAISVSGVIEKSSDVDAFEVDVNNGSFNLTLSPAQQGPMLNGTLTILDAFGNIVKRSATTNLGETLQASVTAGKYVITVSSGGGYGDIGQYTLSGTVPGGGIPPASGHYLIEGTDFADSITITREDDAYRVDVNGEITTLDAVAITQFDILAGDGNDVVTLGPGVCKMYCLGSGGSDTITGSGGNDLIIGGGGDDRLAGTTGSDNMVGGPGRDRLYGEAGNDILNGGAGVDRLYGGEDHDILVGEGSNDKLYGEDGNDSIFGNDGDDLLNGGPGLNIMYGFDGNDTLFARNTDSDYVNGGDGTDSAQLDDTTLDTRDSIETLLA